MTGYILDKSSQLTFDNWMTQLDLICEDPYKVGLLGAISFISFSIGSLLITRVVDIYGRKKSIIISSLVTPAALLILIIEQGKNLYFIYTLMFIIGLTYNVRGSTAYLYGCEFLITSKHLLFGQILFLIAGILMALTAFCFYVFKSQVVFFFFVIVIMTLATSWMILFAPESPHFLLSK